LLVTIFFVNRRNKPTTIAMSSTYHR